MKRSLQQKLNPSFPLLFRGDSNGP